MKIAVGVMAHVSRKHDAVKLRDDLGCEVLVMDESAGENPTGNATWRMLAQLDTEWSIVLQDDALPIPDFRRQAEAALLKAPKTAVSFYVGTGRPRVLSVLSAIEQADSVGASWIRADTLLWGVAVAMPTADIPAYLEWSDRADHFPYDTRIGQWYLRQGKEVYYTWPSLADHADGPTLVHSDRPRPERKAHRIGTPKGGWNDTVVRIKDAGSR